MIPRLAMLPAFLAPAISWMVQAQSTVQRGANVFAESGCLHCNILEKRELKNLIAYLHSCHDRRGR